MNTKEEEQEKVTLDDFVMPQKVDAFVEHYRPSDKQTQTCEVFNDARLREFFKAVPLPGMGDPLNIYLEWLAVAGFKMHVSLTGEPAIFAETK